MGGAQVGVCDGCNSRGPAQARLPPITCGDELSTGVCISLCVVDTREALEGSGGEQGTRGL